MHRILLSIIAYSYTVLIKTIDIFDQCIILQFTVNPALIINIIRISQSYQETVHEYPKLLVVRRNRSFHLWIKLNCLIIFKNFCPNSKKGFWSSNYYWPYRTISTTLLIKVLKERFWLFKELFSRSMKYAFYPQKIYFFMLFTHLEHVLFPVIPGDSRGLKTVTNIYLNASWFAHLQTSTHKIFPSNCFFINIPLIILKKLKCDNLFWKNC